MMLEAKEFLELKEGTILWSAMAGRVVQCEFYQVYHVPSIWGNFPEDFSIDISGHGGLLWGDQCVHFYLDKDEAIAVAKQWQKDILKEAVENAREALSKAEHDYNNQPEVEIEYD